MRHVLSLFRPLPRMHGRRPWVSHLLMTLVLGTQLIVSALAVDLAFGLLVKAVSLVIPMPGWISVSVYLIGALAITSYLPDALAQRSRRRRFNH